MEIKIKFNPSGHPEKEFLEKFEAFYAQLKLVDKELVLYPVDQIKWNSTLDEPPIQALTDLTDFPREDSQKARHFVSRCWASV